MKLSFPNESRSFDASRSRVRFWGYDKTIEISFFVEAQALQKLSAEISNAESGLLKVFGAARQRIHEVADKVYHVRGEKDSYVYILTADDF